MTAASAAQESSRPLGEGKRLGARSSNWVLAKVTTPTVADIHVDFMITGHGTGTGPFVVGDGLSVQGGPHPFSWVGVHRHGGGTPAASMAVGGERQERRFPPLHRTGNQFSTPPYWELDFRASTVAFLLFVPNGVIDEVFWEASVDGVPVKSSIRRGSGATAVMVGAPSEGVAVTAASTGTGVGTYARRTRTGIVGAMEWVSCQACSGSWTAPGASPRRWATVRNHGWAACWCASALGIDTVFAGGPGDWSWTWSGVAAPPGTIFGDDGAYVLGEPVAAAYAPIGRDWTLFRDCRYSQACFSVEP